MQIYLLLELVLFYNVETKLSNDWDSFRHNIGNKNQDSLKS